MPRAPEVSTWSVAPETRRRVADAVIEAFDMYGLAKLRVEDIARIAGVSRPTVYRTFPDRESIMIEVFVHFALTLNARIHDSIPSSASLDRALVGIMRETLTSFVSTRHNRDLLGEQGQDQLSRYSRTSERLQGALIQRWDPYFKAARERGELRADLDVPKAVRWLSVLNASLAAHFEQFEHDLDQVEEYYRAYALPAFVSPTPRHGE